jgi:hypothetical protein
MKYLLIALLISTPALAGQQLVSLEPACARQGTCSPVQKPLQGQRVATGAECPAGSRVYCGDDLPYCCYAPSSQTYYCALDTTHCTRP